MTETQRIDDLVEIHALCARYLSYTARKVDDQWLDVFTPDAEYSAVRRDLFARALPGVVGKRAARPVHREHQDYVAAVRTATREAVREGFILAEDAPAIIKSAKQRADNL